ncbi:MAG: DUF5715 family protein [Flavobacteriales bacterium]
MTQNYELALYQSIQFLYLFTMRLKYVGVFLLSFMLLAFVNWPTSPATPQNLQFSNTEKPKLLPTSDPSIYTCQLNNYLNQYMDRSVKQGIKPVQTTAGLRSAYKAKKLVLVDAQKGFVLDEFQYSYAFLTPYAAQILKEIGSAFKDSIAPTHLASCNLIVTSMTRTHHTVSKLVRTNRTAVRKSPHLNGNSFDFSYARFAAEQELSPEELQYLQTTIAKILLQFKKDIKIWVTFEAREECLHVVARKGI